MRRTGSVFRPRYKDRHGVTRKSNVWWIQFHDLAGKRRREATTATNAKGAEAALRKRLADVEAGKPIETSPATVTLADLWKIVALDYDENKRRSKKRAEQAWAHLGDFFGVPATGKRVEVSQMTIERFLDGKIVEHHRVTDELGLRQQLGLVAP